MVKVKGVNIYPGQIDSLLKEIDGVSSEYQVMIDHLFGKDILTLFVEVENGADKKELEKELVNHFKTKIGITIVAKPVSIEFARSEKPPVFDNRY